MPEQKKYYNNSNSEHIKQESKTLTSQIELSQQITATTLLAFISTHMFKLLYVDTVSGT